MMIYASRDGKQCWSYIGSRQGIGCGSKINSSLAASPSVTRDISRTCYRWHVDAGKIYKLWCWTLISSLDKFHSSQNYTWCVCFLAGAQHSKTANSYTWSPAAWPWPELTCLYMILADWFLQVTASCRRTAILIWQASSSVSQNLERPAECQPPCTK